MLYDVVCGCKKTNVFVPSESSDSRICASKNSLLQRYCARQLDVWITGHIRTTCPTDLRFSAFWLDHWPLKMRPLFLIETRCKERILAESSIRGEQSCLFFQSFLSLSFFISFFLLPFLLFSYSLFIQSSSTFSFSPVLFFPFFVTSLPSHFSLHLSRLSSLSLLWYTTIFSASIRVRRTQVYITYRCLQKALSLTNIFISHRHLSKSL